MKEWSSRCAEFSEEILEIFTFLKSIGIDAKRAKFYALQLVISHKIVSLPQLQSEYEKDPDSFKLLLKGIGMNNKAISTLISKVSGSCVVA